MCVVGVEEGGEGGGWIVTYVHVRFTFLYTPAHIACHHRHPQNSQKTGRQGVSSRGGRWTYTRVVRWGGRGWRGRRGGRSKDVSILALFPGSSNANKDGVGEGLENKAMCALRAWDCVKVSFVNWLRVYKIPCNNLLQLLYLQSHSHENSYSEVESVGVMYHSSAPACNCYSEDEDTALKVQEEEEEEEARTCAVNSLC